MCQSRSTPYILRGYPTFRELFSHGPEKKTPKVDEFIPDP